MKNLDGLAVVYKHNPTPEIVWQVAPLGQTPVANPEQTNAQYLSPDDDYKTNFGEAVVSAGLSDGQVPNLLPFAKHASPFNPVIYAATSSD